MILKINANPEIEQECAIITSEIIINMRAIGAEQVARDFINTVRSGENIYERVTTQDIINALKSKIKTMIGVNLSWEN